MKELLSLLFFLHTITLVNGQEYFVNHDGLVGSSIILENNIFSLGLSHCFGDDKESIGTFFENDNRIFLEPFNNRKRKSLNIFRGDTTFVFKEWNNYRFLLPESRLNDWDEIKARLEDAFDKIKPKRQEHQKNLATWVSYDYQIFVQE